MKIILIKLINWLMVILKEFLCWPHLYLMMVIMLRNWLNIILMKIFMPKVKILFLLILLPIKFSRNLWIPLKSYFLMKNIMMEKFLIFLKNLISTEQIHYLSLMNSSMMIKININCYYKKKILFIDTENFRLIKIPMRKHLYHQAFTKTTKRKFVITTLNNLKIIRESK